MHTQEQLPTQSPERHLPSVDSSASTVCGGRRSCRKEASSRGVQKWGQGVGFGGACVLVVRSWRRKVALLADVDCCRAVTSVREMEQEEVDAFRKCARRSARSVSGCRVRRWCWTELIASSAASAV